MQRRFAAKRTDRDRFVAQLALFLVSVGAIIAFIPDPASSWWDLLRLLSAIGVFVFTGLRLWNENIRRR